MFRSLLILLITPSFLIASNCRVTEVMGEVRYRDPITRSVRYLKKGDRLTEGGKVKLSKNQSLKIVSHRGDKMDFSKKSYFKLTELKQKGSDDAIYIDLYRGKGQFKVTPLNEGSSFKVRTPTAIADVRGTEFELDEGVLTVTEDVVYFEPVDESSEGVAVEEGSTAQINEGGTVEVSETSPSEEDSPVSNAPSNTLSQEEASTENENIEETSSGLQDDLQQSLDDQEAERLIRLRLNINDID